MEYNTAINKRIALVNFKSPVQKRAFLYNFISMKLKNRKTKLML